MSQNISHAVMSQRHEPHDSLDFFPTPPWATRALCEIVLDDEYMHDQTAWDPACGAGHMVRPLGEYFRAAVGSDIFDYTDGGFPRFDFLMDRERRADWIITNPPFRLADQFVNHALNRASHGIAMLVRTQFLESIGRYKNLFSKHRPTTVAIFTERVPMIKGRLSKTASSATSYCWVVWETQVRAFETEFVWIPPCRKRLELAEDYA